MEESDFGDFRPRITREGVTAKYTYWAGRLFPDKEGVINRILTYTDLTPKRRPFNYIAISHMARTDRWPPAFQELVNRGLNELYGLLDRQELNNGEEE